MGFIGSWFNGTNKGNGVITVKGLDRTRWLVFFALVWVVGLFVVEQIRDKDKSWIAGGGAAVVAIAINVYARHHATKSVEANVKFHLWMSLPIVILFGVPLAMKIYGFFNPKPSTTTWQIWQQIIEIVLRLVVPVTTLLWVYVTLGRWRRKIAPEIDDASAANPPANPKDN